MPISLPDDVLTFNTDAGRYLVTRRELFRFGVLCNLPDHRARSLAWGVDADRRVIPGARVFHTLSADMLFERCNADGTSRKARFRPGLRPADPRMMRPANV